MTNMDKLLTILQKRYGRLNDKQITIVADVYNMLTGEFPLITEYNLLPEKTKKEMNDCDEITAELAERMLAEEAEMNKRH